MWRYPYISAASDPIKKDMKKPIFYQKDKAYRKLSSIRKLSGKLLDALEEDGYEPLEGQSMEALIRLLRAFNYAIELYQEGKARGDRLIG